nr:hypothetical protein [Shewanella marina]
MVMKKEVSQLLDKHQELTHSEDMHVESHVQREKGEWYVNTLMLKGYSVPFKYLRQKKYKNLAGSKVNLTYYPETETIAGMSIETMKVVRLKRS